MTYKLSPLFFRYLTIGGVSYVVEMCALFALKQGLGWSNIHAVAVSFWVGFVVAFVLQKFITFKSHERHPRTVARQLFWYSALVAWNYVFTLAFVAMLQHVLSVFIIRTLSIAIITLWNYSAYKVMFRSRI